jgi:glycosyltransferase involved in cell wall biosynthesis
MLNLISNCENLRLDGNLGVAHFTLKTFAALRTYYGINITCNVAPEMLAALERRTESWDELFNRHDCIPVNIKSFMDGRKVFPTFHTAGLVAGGAAIEYVPSHFLRHMSMLPKVVICFDIHLFDVPWKYADWNYYFQLLTSNLKGASAIIVPFLRPFRKLPTLIDGIEDKIFYTDCPTLLADTPLEKRVVDDVRQRYKRSERTKVLIYPAQLQAHKGHKNLIAALAILRERGNDIHLICPGSDFQAEITEGLKDHAAKLGMTEHVTFPGYLSSGEVRALYDICDAVVSPSLAEGGNMIAQEAIAFGRPVACADTEPSREQVRLMQARVPLFDPECPTAIADAIYDLIANSKDYLAANAQARKLIQNWTWEKVAERCMETFHWVGEVGKKRFKDRNVETSVKQNP